MTGQQCSLIPEIEKFGQTRCAKKILEKLHSAYTVIRTSTGDKDFHYQFREAAHMKTNLNGCHSLSDFRVFAQIAGPFPHTVELSRMDSRNELFRSSRITLKKSFPKFIKNSSRNRF